VRLKVLDWKRDFKGKTFKHEAYVEINASVIDTKQVMMTYTVKCLDTGVQTMSSELRSEVNGEITLLPNWQMLETLREGAM